MENNETKQTFRGTFITGLFVTLPLALTVVTVTWLFKTLDNLLGHYLNEMLGTYYITGLGLILTIMGIYGMGAIARTVLGRQMITATEGLILRVPLLKSFYNTFKQLGEAFSPDNKASFKKFVIVEYPRAGVHSFGFLTKECIIKNGDGERCYNTVYIPTNHLYLGEVCLFPKDEVMDTGLSIEEGIKIIISAGITAPNIISAGNGADAEIPPAIMEQLS